MEKKVSIIIPVYNCDKYIFECLKSVENQTYKNIEVIIINDGSKDSSLRIIKKFINKNKKWILIDQKNQGLSMARNNGFIKTTGYYVFFLDGDDELPVDSIEKLLYNAEKNNSDVVIGNMINYNSKGRYPNYTSKYITEKDDINYHSFPKLISFIHAAGKLYKKETIKNIKFISGVKHEDNYFNLSLFLKKVKISMIKNDVYYHRIREGSDKSITQSLDYNSFKDLLINLDKLLDENTIDIHINKILTKKVMNYALLKINKNDYIIVKNHMYSFFKKLDSKTNMNKIEKILNIIFRKIYFLTIKILSFIK